MSCQSPVNLHLTLIFCEHFCQNFVQPRNKSVGILLFILAKRIGRKRFVTAWQFFCLALLLSDWMTLISQISNRAIDKWFPEHVRVAWASLLILHSSSFTLVARGFFFLFGGNKIKGVATYSTPSLSTLFAAGKREDL